MESQLKSKARAEELQNYKIKDLQEGKDLVAEIDERSNNIFNAMRGDISHQLHTEYTELLYEFKNARRNIQTQMGAIVKRHMKEILHNDR